jgi:hypothetical protein
VTPIVALSNLLELPPASIIDRAREMETSDLIRLKYSVGAAPRRKAPNLPALVSILLLPPRRLKIDCVESGPSIGNVV